MFNCVFTIRVLYSTERIIKANRFTESMDNFRSGKWRYKLHPLTSINSFDCFSLYSSISLVITRLWGLEKRFFFRQLRGSDFFVLMYAKTNNCAILTIIMRFFLLHIRIVHFPFERPYFKRQEYRETWLRAPVPMIENKKVGKVAKVAVLRNSHTNEFYSIWRQIICIV